MKNDFAGVLIEGGYSQGVYYDIYCCYNSKANQVLLSWADKTNQNPFYAVYDFQTSSFSQNPTQIAPTYTDLVYADIFTSFNSQDEAFFAGWASELKKGYYSLFFNSLLENRLLLKSMQLFSPVKYQQ